MYIKEESLYARTLFFFFVKFHYNRRYLKSFRDSYEKKCAFRIKKLLNQASYIDQFTKLFLQCKLKNSGIKLKYYYTTNYIIAQKFKFMIDSWYFYID